MVQFLPPTTKGRLTEETGKGLGTGIGAALQEAGEYKRQRGRLQDALKSIENISPEDQKNPMKLLTSVLSATAGIPGSERYVAPLFENLLKQSAIKASQQTAPPGQGNMQSGQGNQKPGVASFKEQAPNFANQTTQSKQQPRTPEAEAAMHPSPEPAFVDANKGAVAPRRSTELVPPSPLMNPQEMTKEAQRIAQQKTAQGFQTTWEAEMPQVEAENARRSAYNQGVDAENKNIIQYRDKLQGEAVKAYNQHVPKDEQTAPDQKRFENYYLEGSDKTDPERFDYARRRIDALRAARANAETFPDRPNWYKDIYRRLEGSERSTEQALGEMHGVLKPLTDLGEFQEARNIAINKFGLGPDETERVIHPMPEDELKRVRSIPEAKSRSKQAPAILGGSLSTNQPNEKNISILEKHISSLINENPDISLIQTRNILGKKGYDWREFSQAIQNLQNKGKLKGLSQDTLNNINQLYNPPLKGMMNIFENIIFGKE